MAGDKVPLDDFTVRGLALATGFYQPHQLMLPITYQTTTARLSTTS